MDSPWTLLKRMLVDNYDQLREQLARQVGSEDLAGDALQDTFLRLERGGEISGPLDSPRGFLYRIALNFAGMRSRSERRRLSIIDVNAVLDAVDDQPGPGEIEEGKSDLRALERALAEMPERRRAIFAAAWIEGVPHREIAERHHLSLRMIQIELKQAVEHIAERFAKADIVDFAARRRGSLSE